MASSTTFGWACVLGVIAGCLAGGCVVVIDRGAPDIGWIDVDDSPSRSRPRIGIKLDKPSATTASQLQIERKDATVITGVNSGSPAERAGLQQYDVIIAVDGNEEADPSDVRRAIRSRNWGDTVTFRVMRQGVPLEVPVLLERDQPARATPSY